MRNVIAIFLLLIISAGGTFGQTKDPKAIYRQAFNEQLQMLKNPKSINFKRAVFITENAYSGGQLNYQDFCNEIGTTGTLLKQFVKQRGLENYKTSGNYAVFTFMMDSSPLNNYKPLTYDFDDFMGDRDWKSMFVTKLMKTHQGNCHSLPYYYKILCEEIGANANLALGPNHVYIKHIDEKGQWANVELTSGGFPRDQWIIQQMNISVEAIKSGSYMAPLSAQESIAMTMFDLASAYQYKFGYDSFVLEVANTALFYFPKCICLLQTKANFYKNAVEVEKKKTNPDTSQIKAYVALYKEINDEIDRLGYKEDANGKYGDWVQAVKQEKIKRDSSEKK